MSDSLVQETEGTINASIVAVVLLLFALFTPILLNASSNTSGEINYQLISITWTMSAYNSAPRFTVSGGVFTAFVFLRLLFIDQMYKYYKNRVSRNRAILTGIISELPLVLIVSISILLSLGMPLNATRLLLPIPLLFVIGLLFLFITPVHPALQWIEKEIAQQDSDSDSETPS